MCIMVPAAEDNFLKSDPKLLKYILANIQILRLEKKPQLLSCTGIIVLSLSMIQPEKYSWMILASSVQPFPRSLEILKADFDAFGI